MPEWTKSQAAPEALAKLSAKPKKRGRPKGSKNKGKRGLGRPRKGLELTPKTLVGVLKRKPGHPKGSGKGKPGRKPGKPKGSGKVGRPKGNAGRPKASGGVSKGQVAGLVAKAVKARLKADKAGLKVLVQGLVAKEVKKALKAAL